MLMVSVFHGDVYDIINLWRLRFGEAIITSFEWRCGYAKDKFIRDHSGTFIPFKKEIYCRRGSFNRGDAGHFSL